MDGNGVELHAFARKSRMEPIIHLIIFPKEIRDILYIKDGATSGIATINDIDEEFSLLSSVALLKPSRLTNNKYLCSIMQSAYLYAAARGDMKGVGITRNTLTMINSRLIPVVPLEEQVRITKYLQQPLPFTTVLLLGAGASSTKIGSTDLTETIDVCSSESTYSCCIFLKRQ